MDSIDVWLEGLMHGSTGVGVILAISLLLGLRHASDPDHLAAVTTLIASEEEHGQVRKASWMGFCWGLGHGTTLVILGLPLVLLNRFLPERVGQLAEVAIGIVIVVLAVRLLMRWRRGVFHVHTHRHEGASEEHRHVHSHKESRVHEHGHTASHRGPLGAYGVGLVHGIGGSGGLTLLLLSTISSQSAAVAALLIFAAGTALSMAILSTVFGLIIARGPIRENFEYAAPVLGVLSLAFGLWYGLGALEIVTYPF
ncbi:sulfite exporter TauE/SafE family protein [Rubrobacter indicoceani]|uniref:HoxN/HupN/NixA family nickel/cobalt transporter n=1 Tax=Rubrobacter indicoceani TaxID=2051957 RepID=UPI000E5AAFDD|nr:sulfite exporter TauE/SafE family protein [Rubrobacter indicoceani]